jgi:hypothetical protein
MINELINIAIILLASSLLTSAQEIKTENASQTNTFRDNTLGISFSKVGKVEKVDSSSYRIILNAASDGSQNYPVAEVATSNELFVDLPGSYGGRLYLGSTEQQGLLKDRIYVDTTESDSVKFTREYWTVYAGMGGWDCVINCYARRAEKYYIISLVNDVMAGKPGEYVNGRKLTAKEVKATLLRTMQDTTNTMVQKFNALVTSFKIDR